MSPLVVIGESASKAAALLVAPVPPLAIGTVPGAVLRLKDLEMTPGVGHAIAVVTQDEQAEMRARMVRFGARTENLPAAVMLVAVVPSARFVMVSVVYAPPSREPSTITVKVPAELATLTVAAADPPALFKLSVLPLPVAVAAL